MLIAPENIELNKLVRKRTFNFDTANRMYGNLIIVGTDTYDEYGSIFTSKLFKPQQLFSVFTPRRVKPMGRVFVSFFQKDVYDMIKSKTHGFFKIGKAITSSYVGRNLVYDIIPDYTETYKLLSTIKKADAAQHIYMQQYFEKLIDDKTNEMNYEKNYLIFPMSTYIPNFKQKIQMPNSDNHTPIINFLKSLRFGTLDAKKYERIDRVFFYNPNADAMVAMDLKNPETYEKFLDYFTKINRLNNFNNNSDTLDDVIETPDEITDSDNISNTKEKIKNIVLNNVANKLKTKLDDYDEASMDEKAIITSIDKKIDKYLNSEENVAKPFKDLVAEVENDRDVATKAVNYIEKKKLAQKQLQQLSKNIDVETQVINSIDDIEDDEKFFEPEKVKATLPPLINDRVQYSSLLAMDDKYNKVQAKQDLISCIAAFSDQDYLPITIVDWKLVDSSDDFTLKDTLTVRYKTDENKILSFKIDIPKVFDGHCIKVKGNTYIIQKQLCRLPIVKTKENRVEITTNFNKITCERTNGNISRKNAYLKKILQKYKLNPAYNIEYGYNTELISSYKNDFEFEETASFLSKISDMKYTISTNRPDVEKEFELLPYPESFKITDSMTPVGFVYGSGDKKELLYIQKSKVFAARLNEQTESVNVEEIAPDLYTLIVRDILHDDVDMKLNIGKSYVYSNCKFICVTYPIFVFCGLNIGITATLKRAKIKYKVSDSILPHSNSVVEVKFKNKYLYYEDKIENTLLLNVLSLMNTENWDYEDFDTDAPYVDYCVNILGQPVYVKQTVKVNISKLIDPITREVLNYLKLPTDPYSLLILANNMLTNNSFIPKNDLCNYRVRGNELIYTILYEIIAKAYYKYQNAKLNGSNKETIKIGQNELISALISQQNINILSNLNPVLEMESAASCSMKGHKGINLRDAFTIELRSFSKSMEGILSANSTPFSGSVGIQRALTINPKINHVRGYIPSINLESLDATNLLSASEILNFTTATRADAPRAAMQVGQTKHGVPTYVSHKQLIGSGFDHAMPYMLSDGFCFKAKKDGIVESINNKESIAILKYDDGTYDAIDLRESMAKNASSGFYINQTYTMKYEVNEAFKAGDVIAYNPSFFKGRGNDCSYTQGTLAKMCITSGDFVFEDSTCISENLSEKCASDITMAKAVAIGPNAIIHNIAKVGDHVNVNDELLDFTTSFNDPTTTAFLQDLIDTVGSEEANDIGNEKILSKYPGRISDIDIYYNVPFETLSPTLQKLITDYNKEIEKRKSIVKSKGIHTSALKLKAVGQQKETKINGTEFEGVLIIFYVTHKDTLSIGDKLVYNTALKGIVTKVVPNEEAPRSTFRDDEIIDGCLAGSGVPSRLTLDIFPIMYSNKALIELGRWIHEEWTK